MKLIMKLLYLFSGTRKGKFTGTPGINYPDTQLYGLNHLKQFGIEAETKEWTDVIRSTWLQKFFGFRLRHFIMFFATRRYDMVFGSSLLYLMILKKIFRPKTKYILFNLGITRTIATHRTHKFCSWALHSLLKEFAGVVCLAHVQKAYLEQHCPYLRGKVFYVPLGVDTKYYQPKFSGRNDRILSAGRDNGRDYKTLIDAARLLPNRQFDIVCSQRNLVGVTDIPNNVTVHFDLPITKLRELYDTAQLLVLSTHDDTWLDGSDCSGQTVLLDAMASGIPVIATRKKYLNDYVVPGKEALVVDCYKPEQIAYAIRELEDPARRQSLAESDRAKVEKEFYTVQMAKQLAEVFKKL